MRIGSSLFFSVVLSASGCNFAQDLGGGSSLGGGVGGQAARSASVTVSGTGGSVAVSSTGGSVHTSSSTAGVGGAGVGTTVASTGAGGGAACSPGQQATIRAMMDQAPIKPGQAALLDIAGPGGTGLTLPEAQQILCQGTDLGDEFGDGSQVNTWGANQEVQLDYAPATGKAVFLTLWWPGYAGALQMTSRDGQHLYEVPLGAQITKDGQPYQLDWDPSAGLVGPQLAAELNELYDALLATYLPSAPADPDCQAAACSAGSFGDVGFVFFKSLGLGVWVASISAPQPVPSVPNRFDIYPL